MHMIKYKKKTLAHFRNSKLFFYIILETREVHSLHWAFNRTNSLSGTWIICDVKMTSFRSDFGNLRSSLSEWHERRWVPGLWGISEFIRLLSRDLGGSRAGLLDGKPSWCLMALRSTGYAHHLYTSRPSTSSCLPSGPLLLCPSMDTTSRAVGIHGNLSMRHFVKHMEHGSLGTFAQQMFRPCGCRVPLGVSWSARVWRSGGRRSQAPLLAPGWSPAVAQRGGARQPFELPE